MRHYQLVPVRYNAQQLLTRCEPIDAELWSIQWAHCISYPGAMPKLAIDHENHWFADVAPLEHDNAQAIVDWMNNREAFAATLPPLYDVRPFNRSK